MMLIHKKLSLFLLFSFIFSWGFSQTTTVTQIPGSGTIVTAVPFLLINGNPQSAGMGDIGVVSSPAYYPSDLSQNPALVARGKNTVGFQANYTPWLSALGIQDMYLFNLGGHITFDGKHVLTYRSRIFNLGQVAFTSATGQVIESNPQEHAHGLGYTAALNKNLSLGMRINYLFSNVPYGGNSGRSVNSFAGDLGLLYHNTIVSDELTRVVWSTGLSIQNLGPKVSYSANSPIEGFLPTNFQLGGMLGLHNTFNGDSEFVIEGAYQLSKLMVPSEGVFSDKGAFQGMISSWGDANDVGKQESQEFIHQVGLELRLQKSHELMIALRGGLFLEHQLSGARRYSTYGVSLAAYGFRADLSYLRSFQQTHPLQNTLRIGLTFLVDDAQEDFGLIKF